MPFRAVSPMKKAFIVLVVFLCIVITIAVCLSYYLIYDHQKREIVNSNMSLLMQVDSKLQLVLRSIDTETIQLLQTKDVWEFMERDFQTSSEYSDYLINQLNTRSNILLNSNDGIVSMELYSYMKNRLSSGTKLNDGQIPEDYRWIQSFEKSGSFFEWMPARNLMIDPSSEIYHSVITLVRSYPITHPVGFRKGAIAINLSERAIYNLIKDAVAASKGNIYMMSGDGRIISHENKSLLGKTQSEAKLTYELPLAEDKGTLKTKIDGQDQSVFYITSTYTGWKMISVIPDYQLNEPLTNIRSALIKISIVLLTLALLIAMLVNRWTFRPISRVIGTVLKNSKMNDSDKYTRKGINEFNRFEMALSSILEDSSRLQKQMAENKSAVKWRLVMDMLTGVRKNGEELHGLLATIGYPLRQGPVIVLAAEFDRRGSIESPKDMHLYCYALCNVVEEIVNAEDRGVAIECADGMVAILMSFDVSDAEDLQLRAYANADMIRKYVEDHFKRTITVGIGALVEELSEVKSSYLDAREVLKYKMIIGSNAIICIDDIRGGGSKEYFKMMGYTETILDSIRLLDKEKARTQLDTWFQRMGEAKISGDMINQLVLQFIMRVLKILDDMGIAADEQALSVPFAETMAQFESMQETSDYILKLLDQCMALIQQKRMQLERTLDTADIIKFVRSNFGRSDLSLNALAEQFRLSIYYVSRVFKETTGENFIDYLTALRVEKAKELLVQSDSKIREISEQVGYSNANSFIRIFKKSTGLTPTEYRDMCK